MMGSSSSWFTPNSGSAMVSSSSWPTATFGSAMSSSSPSFAPTFGAPAVGWTPPMPHPAPSPSTLFGSSTSQCSWTAPAFGVSSIHSPFGSFGHMLGKGSRISAYTQTIDADCPNSFAQPSYYVSISAMPVYSNKSHEELRLEDYQAEEKGGYRLQKSIFPSYNYLWQPQPPVKPPMIPFSEAAVKPFAELQSSTQGLNRITNPFWLPSAGPQSPLFSYPAEPIRRTSLLSNPTEPIHNPQTGLQKNVFSFCPSSLPAPLFASGGNLSSTMAYTASADTSPTQSHMFSQNFFPAKSTQSGGSLLSSSLAHSAPALSPTTQSTTINIDHSNKTIEFVLPIDITQVKITFSSRNDGTGGLASQVHPNGKASASPVSFSIYPGENQELNIRSIEQHSESQTGKPCSSTGGLCPNNQNGPAGAQKGNSRDVHLTETSPLAAPGCKLISESVLPRLYKADYYTVPLVVELAARESDEPGYCSHVKDFTVGRHGYGSLKFDGETDVRKLDITSIVEFKEREIVVYRDESKTPPVGQELNKPAEVTLLNVKCVDLKTGLQLMEGTAVENYREILAQWTKDHGAEFVSFDAAKGEWKFKVKHFNQ